MFYPRFAGNPHLARIRARLGSLAVPPGVVPRLKRVVLLCYTNRSGSNYLASLLSGTRLMNLPVECLNADNLLREAEAAGLASFADTIAHIIATAAIEGHFALKIAAPHLEVLGESGLLQLWRDRLHCIHLERQDLLGQAISWEIAEQTGQWTSISAPENATVPIYRRADILAARDRFAHENRQFNEFFSRNDLAPQHLFYQDLEAAPAAHVARLLAGMGLPPLRIQPERVPIRRQRGALNEAWRQRFLSEET